MVIFVCRVMSRSNTTKKNELPAVMNFVYHFKVSSNQNRSLLWFAITTNFNQY